jgi:tetratricopeptide (TPR) repeat protein
MSEAHRSDTIRAHDVPVDADRDAKIEHLLLVGLDHYFAARYERAIHVWTRALFLDRSHPRARAYIERARSALAERQRESEELLQNGVAAFHRGESDEARRLLRAAIEGGAPSEEALAVLDRLDRLETGAAALPASSRRAPTGAAPSRTEGTGRSPVVIAAVVAIVVGLLVIGGYAAGASEVIDWRSWLAEPDVTPSPAQAPIVHEQVPALPRRGEMALVRARSLAASGHLSDALTALDAVRPTDPQKADADRLRADIQRQLLALAGGDRLLP